MFNEEHFNRFINFVFDGAAPCVELACWHSRVDPQSGRVKRADFPVTAAGYFDDLKALKMWARKVHGTSAYVTFNPLSPDCLARVAVNKVAKVEKGCGTVEADVLAYRFLFIDIDCSRGTNDKVKISSTAAELQEAIDLRNRIVEARPPIAESAIWGTSGNGAWILARLESDEPNTPKTKAKIKSVLEELAAAFGKKGKSAAFVDTNPHFPNAHICLPGTMKCKGTSTDDRPHRLVTVDGGNY